MCLEHMTTRMTKYMYIVIEIKQENSLLTLKKVNRRYNKNIQNIFLILDNLSAHKSKLAKKEISQYCPRIKLVFLPVRSPELNLIEVRWSWLQRQ